MRCNSLISSLQCTLIIIAKRAGTRVILAYGQFPVAHIMIKRHRERERDTKNQEVHIYI